MADPKYADLPGIAYDQPDVYETDDLPEADQSTNFYEEETDSIERLHITANEAFGRFKGKSLNASTVDFSDRVTKNRRSGYDVQNWEIVGDGEKETPLQKYQRLQLEIRELAEEVAELKAEGGGAGGDASLPAAAAAAAHLEQQIEASEQQLRALRMEDALGAHSQRSQGALITRLLAELEGAPGKPGEAPAKQGQPGQPGRISYELHFLPEQAALSRSSRLAQLEERVRNAERTLGATPHKVASLCVDPRDSARPRSLVEAVHVLSAKVSLLDTAHLDHVEGRLIALAQKMDAIAEKSCSVTEDAERDHKVIELYELMKKNSEEISQILPETLERIVSLHSLNQQAAAVAGGMGRVEAQQEQLAAQLRAAEVDLRIRTEAFQQQLQMLSANMAQLGARVDALAAQ